ncbi:hypothetical protein VMCG_06464 [Cytospora schulzeri]|uniref:Uncharacterized protein n=1 Tax=Cytospora schulzeri TaxID=448051 RepID=A0A423WBI3_9PEZI|nr:hypothetical protein VMCG_06464 [Valsa malicola]
MAPKQGTVGPTDARTIEIYEEPRKEYEERERAEASLTEEERAEDLLAAERGRLREHMGLPRTPGDPAPQPPRNIAAFFIEKAPGQARCRLPTCLEPIPLGDYRLALAPSMNSTNWHRGRLGSVDYYHIRCFEEIADFSDSTFLDRLYPVTRNTYPLKGTGTLTGGHLLDAGAESLVTAWSISRDRLIDERDGVQREVDQTSKDYVDLILKAGTPGFRPPRPDDMTSHEYSCRINRLAPIESDGHDDTEPWSLHEEYLDDSPESLDNKHDLSEMLELWRIHRRILYSGDETPEMQVLVQKLEDQLGPKGLRAIERMSVVLMPDLQAMHFGALAGGS